MSGKSSSNFERLQHWRESGGSVEKAELHARLMAALIVKKDKLTSRQLRLLCKALVPGLYEATVALLAGVGESATVEDLQAALDLIERPPQRDGGPRPGLDDGKGGAG